MADRTVGNQEAERSQTATRTLDIREQAHDLGTQIQERAQEAGRQVRDWAQEAGNTLQEKVQDARHQIGETASQVSEISRNAISQLDKTLEDRIRQQPLQSVLIAAGIGLLIGLLWKK